MKQQRQIILLLLVLLIFCIVPTYPQVCTIASSYPTSASTNGHPPSYHHGRSGQTQNQGGVVPSQTFNSASTTGVTCIGSGCPLQCVNSQTCQGNSGSLVGNTCYICGAGEQVVNGACVVLSSVSNVASNVVSNVENCGTNQYYTGSVCLCIGGFVMVNSNCYQTCGTNGYLFDLQCQCLPGYVYSSVSTDYCVLQNTQNTISCGVNQQLVNNVCVCTNGLGFFNGQCVICPVNTYLDPNGNCACSPGYSINPSTLTCSVTCFANAYPNSLGQCICTNGYYNQGNYCVPQGTCQNGQVWNGTACTCLSGMVMDTILNNCTYCNLPNRQIVNNLCVCAPAYYPISTGCNPCVPNSVYSASVLTCVCNNGYQMSNGQCITATYCPVNSNWNTALQQCACLQSGQYVINGYCQVCPQFSIWGGSACVCQSGYVLTGSLCIQNCGSNSYWNGQSCVCNSGYYIINGACQYCDPNSYYSNTAFTCICNNGYYGTWNQCSPCSSTCSTCSGPNANQCLSCPQNTIAYNGYCNTATNCGTGYYPFGNQCLQCDSSCLTCSGAGPALCSSCRNNFAFNNGYCTAVTIICNTGFYPSNNQCLQCDSTCLTCNGNGPSMCTTCPNNEPLTSGYCGNNCNSGQYSNPTSHQCQQCHSACATCNGTGSTHCIRYKNSTRLLTTHY